MHAQIQSGGNSHGLVVKNEAGRSVMLVGLPTHTADSLGKLMHPSQATLFKATSGGGREGREEESEVNGREGKEREEGEGNEERGK